MARYVLLLALLVAVAAGCGSSNPPGKTAEKVIDGDWEGAFIASKSPFPSRPDLAGFSTVKSNVCTPRMDARRQVRCSLVVSDGSSLRHVGVVATFGSNGVLQRWEFAH